jgi:hypothetical protein
MQKLCDFQWSAEDIITTDKYKKLVDTFRPIDAYYMKADLLTNRTKMMNWRGDIHTLENSKVWVTGHGDVGVSGEIFEKYKGCMDEWWAVNVDYRHPRLHCLPLGLTNPTRESWLHPIYSDISIMLDTIRAVPEGGRHGLAYMNFDTNTYSGRKIVFQIFEKKPWVTVGEKINNTEGRRKYLTELRKHKFCIAPRGNGIDTHRLWESLYMGCIPIVGRDILVEEFAAHLPILIVDRWEDVTPEFLEEAWKRMSETEWNMEALRVGYWLKKLGAAIRARQI